MNLPRRKVLIELDLHHTYLFPIKLIYTSCVPGKKLQLNLCCEPFLQVVEAGISKLTAAGFLSQPVAPKNILKNVGYVVFKFYLS